MTRLYLDHAATTPLCEPAREAMLQWLSPGGNPSSLHQEGRRAKDAIDSARETLSEALGCLFAEVLFTASGTEAANLAIIGAALKNVDPSKKRILLGAAEHHCVLHTRPVLEKLGYQVELIRTDREARVNLLALQESLGPDVLLVSVMHANNEIGTLQPIREVADCCHKHGALLHCDAVQTFLAFPWKVGDLDADLVTLSAHKVNGPVGVGAIYMRAGVKLQPLTVGGGQEREMRAGTENVAAIAGFDAALRWRRGRYPTSLARNAFLGSLGDDWRPSAHLEGVLPGHAHGRFPGIEAETLLIRLDRMGLAASSGAACSSGSIEPSHVLLASGYTEQEAKEGLRFTFGLESSVREAEEAADLVRKAVDGIGASR